MFEHLDDEEFVPSDRFRRAVLRDGERRQRRRRRVAFGVAIAPALLVAGSLAYIRQQAGELQRVPVGGLTPVPTVPDETGAPDEAGPGPVNILVVGSDARAPGDPDAQEVMGMRADSIAVVRIDAANHRIGIMSIPRDLLVEVDGERRRINSYLADGPDRLVHVVTTTFGIEINHYVEVGFDGFRRIVDLAGGITIPFDAPERDTYTGFTTTAGCVRLNGAQALAYVRSRHLQRYDATTGRWEQDPRADLGRIERQQEFALRTFAAFVAGDFSRVDEVRLLTDVLDDITVDDGLDLGGLRALLATARSIGTGATSLYGLGGVVSGKVIDGQAVLVADPAALHSVAALLMGATPDVPTPDASTSGAETPDSETSTTAPDPGLAC
jgi:LCP family protein required for cell wall assembly